MQEGTALNFFTIKLVYVLSMKFCVVCDFQGLVTYHTYLVLTL